MASAQRETSEHRYPRWFVWCVALGTALIYFCAFAVVDIFPFAGNQEHGWPLVYMVRASRVPGGLTVLYGPWPFSDPPLVSFQPAKLVLDSFCGFALAILTSSASVYWLRVHHTRIHFSLRGLFVITTLAAVACGLLKWFYPDPTHYAWEAIEVLLIACCLLVVLLPGYWLLTAAHWLVVRLSAAGRNCRSFGVHWLTWVSTVAVASLCLYCPILQSGWPLQYFVTSRKASQLWGFLGWAFVADLSIWLAMTCAMALVVEGWIRRVERGILLRRGADIAFAAALFVAIWISPGHCWLLNDWFEYYAWFIGTTLTVFAIEVLPLRHWGAVPKMTLLPGIVVAAAIWFVLSRLIGDDRLAIGLSLVSGATLAAVIDSGLRLCTARQSGISRFVQRGRGEQVWIVPVWMVAIVLMTFGLALSYQWP